MRTCSECGEGMETVGRDEHPERGNVSVEYDCPECPNSETLVKTLPSNPTGGDADE